MAETFGANRILHASTGSLEMIVNEAPDIKPIDIVIDTIATKQTFQDALAVIRKGGTICLVGGYTQPLNLFLAPIVSKELQVMGSICYGYSGNRKNFDAVLDLVATKQLNPLPLITHRFPLIEIRHAFHTAADKTSRSIKVLIRQ